MALVATTLSGAITTSVTSFGVASATNITVPNNQTGVGITFLLVENELMLVTGVSGTVVSVSRGYNGTQAAAHGATAPVISGLGSDFAGFTPAQGSFTVLPNIGFNGWSAPVAGAATNVATGALFHLTGTVAMVNLTAPANYIEGTPITIVFDGSAAGLTWTAAGNIAVAGTATTAASAVSFTFDSGSAKWHPSRLA